MAQQTETMTANESKGFYKLSWLQRIGFGSGDLAQNLIFQVICTYLLFFYTDIYGLTPSAVAIMFLVGNVANVIWDPIVGALIDKSNPRFGKYRSYLLYVGIPLSGFAILCFWNGFAPSLIYAYVTYIAMQLLYTFINVPYGALNSSLTRDTNEITILTSVRMFMANLGGLAVNSGLPLFIALIAGAPSDSLPKDSSAWFTTMTVYAIVGFCLLLFCFSQCKERVVMDAKATESVKVSDLWMEFLRNRPLRVLAFFFITAFAMMSVGNAAGAYFINKHAAKAILDDLQANRCDRAIDLYHYQLIEEKVIDYLWCHPTLATQGTATGAFETSLSANKKHLRKLSWLFQKNYKLLLYWFR